MSEGYFEAIKAGRLPPPECAKTLGLEIIGYDLDAHTVELEFEGRPEFANPIGIVQGGFLSAMLDDAMGLAAATAMNLGEFSPTLNLNVQFHRPAKNRQAQGHGTHHHARQGYLSSGRGPVSGRQDGRDRHGNGSLSENMMHKRERTR